MHQLFKTIKTYGFDQKVVSRMYQWIKKMKYTLLEAFHILFYDKTP